MQSERERATRLRAAIDRTHVWWLAAAMHTDEWGTAATACSAASSVHADAAACRR